MSLEPSSAEATDGSSDPVAAPATSPAFALVAADGSVVAAGGVFERRIGVEVVSTPALASAVAAVTVANQPLVGLTLDAPAGPGLATQVEAVLSAQDQRLALIEVQLPRPAAGADALAAWFPSFADDAPAIVWLKDLEGRYRWVNRQYTESLGVDGAAVVGHLDAELGQLEAIDGPRLRAGSRSAVAPETPRAEPLSLEYTIPGFDRRPAYAALRFPLTDPAGTPLAVCGVASPAEHSEVARAECAQLLEVAAWFRGDARTLRHGVMERWEIRAVRPQGSVTVELPGPPPPAPAAAAFTAPTPATPAPPAAIPAPPASAPSAALEERLRILQAQVARIPELEAMIASANAAGVAASRDAEHAAEIVALREESEALRSALATVRGQLADAEARHAEELSAHARHEDELSDIQDRVRTELNAANQRHRVEMSQLRDEHDALLAEHLQLTEREHQARADATALRDQLSAALAQLRELQSARAASRDQIARLERAVAAAAATTPAPPSEAVPESAARSEPPLPPAPATVPEPPTAAATAAVPVTAPDEPRAPDRVAQLPAASTQLGWDLGAQQALASALSGCLNFRSILSESVRLIGLGGGWDAVVAWLPDTREGRLSCAATWVRSPVEMARLETSMWQVRQSPSASAVGAAATSSEIVWITSLDSDADRHLASLHAEGIATVALVPVRQQGQTSAVLELCTRAVVRASPEADAALRSIEVEVAAANQRLVDAANAGQWGRRRR